MGKTLMGGAKHTGNVSLLTKEQKAGLSQLLGAGLGPGADALTSVLQGLDPEVMEDIFQTRYVDPAMKVFEQQLVPGLQQQFLDVGAGSSSALNQALAQGATDLSTMLGSQYGQFVQGQQQNALGGLGLLSGLLQPGTFQPMIQQQQGLLGPLIQGGATIGAAALSSRDVKENIHEYEKGLEKLEKMDVKQYKYTFEDRERVGLIAEEVPEEIRDKVDGINAVDLYGLMGILVNSVKELSKRVQALEA